MGVSLSPYKNFQPFSTKSDIDVAIISPYHFDTAWRHLRTLRRSNVTRGEWEAIISHKENYIYWGCIATDKILHLLPFSRSWVEALAHVAGLSPADGRDTGARIYRDAGSLRDYTVASIRSRKNKLGEVS